MSEPNPFVQLFLTRMREFIREPEVVFWVFFFPILLAVGLGIAFRNKPPDQLPVGIIEGAGAEEVRQALQTPGLHIHVLPEGEAMKQLRLGRLALVVAPGQPLHYRFDGTRPDSAQARLVVDQQIQKAAGRTDPVITAETLVTEPGARYIDFLIPGLLGMNIMSGGMWGVGYHLTEMRTNKVLKRLRATPMRRTDFLAANMASRMAIVILEVGLLLGFGWLAFDMAIRGSLITIVFLALLGAMTFSGIGMLVASRARKIETVGGLMNLVMLPMFVFSGVFFSAERFPEIFLPAIRALPLTALNDALRATILEGAGLFHVLPQVAILLLWTLISFLTALKIFRWT